MTKRRRRSPRTLARPLAMFSEAPGVTPRIQAAFDEAVRKFSHRPYVTGVDVGYKFVDQERTRQLAVRIHIREKFSPRSLSLRDRFPRKINGVPVDVIEASYEFTESAVVGAPAATLQPGVSIGRLDDTTGTLGLFVSDNRNPGLTGFLSAAHVLFSGAGLPNDPIVQPGTSDGGGVADEIGRNARAYRPSDAALARLTTVRPWIQTTALSGVTLTAPRQPVLGEVLEKCGRSTQVTRALVDGIGHYLGVRDSMRLIGLDDDPIVDFGDSGAVWYDPLTGAAVGLHAKGPVVFTPSANFAVAGRLTVITGKLDVTVL